MAKTTEKKRKVSLESFFTKTNEIKGKWFEPKIKNQGVGFEFLVCGAGTDEAMADDEHFDSLYAQAENIKDPVERNAQKQLVDAQRCARLVKGLRPAEGVELDYDNKPIEYTQELIEQIFLQSPLIKKAVVAFATETANFINWEKRS